jgi:hypothetical protein
VDANARIDAEIKSGALHLPSGPTSGYRILGPMNAYDPATGRATPEMQFWQSIHMPYRTAKDFGVLGDAELSSEEHSRMPFAMASGTWWAHVMIMHPTP